MDTTSKQEISATGEELPRAQARLKVVRILQEADKALLAKKPVVANSGMRLAQTELKLCKCGWPGVIDDSDINNHIQS